MLTERRAIGRAKNIFFFPFYHTGGAEMVHLNIVNAVHDPDNYIFFTDKSYSDHLKTQFSKYAKTAEVYEFLNRNAMVKKIFTMFLAEEINKSKKLKAVFGCNAIFYYELLPYLKREIIKIDLVHAFSKPDHGIENVSLPYVSYLDKRVVINKKTDDDFAEMYKENNLEIYSDRITIIPNGIVFNEKYIPKKHTNKALTIGFVGRWQKEKRPELFLKIVQHFKQNNSEIKFLTAGTHTEAYKEEIIQSGIENFGEITNAAMYDLYQEMDIILITSYREGLPVVLMEAMACGVIPVSTNVGSIGEHLSHNENGFLIENTSNIDTIVVNFVTHIQFFLDNREKLRIISENAAKYARNEFGIANFNEKYNALLQSKS